MMNAQRSDNFVLLNRTENNDLPTAPTERLSDNSESGSDVSVRDRGRYRRSRSTGRMPRASSMFEFRPPLARSNSSKANLPVAAPLQREDGYYVELPKPKQKAEIFRVKSSLRHVITKIGTSTSMKDGKVNEPFFQKLARDISYLEKNMNIRCTLVISGAVEMGRSLQANHAELLENKSRLLDDLDLNDETKELRKNEYKITQKQELAGIGQPMLYAKISQVLYSEASLRLCQVLVTKADMDDIHQNPDTHNTIYGNTFSKGVVNVINANDTLCRYQMASGDNDNLSIKVGVLIKADAVVILSDIDGIYTGRPERDNPDVYHIPYVDESNMSRAYDIAGGPGTAGGTGGMAAKVKSINEVAFPSGMAVAIAKGGENVERPLLNLLHPEVDTWQTSTWFIPRQATEVRGEQAAQPHRKG